MVISINRLQGLLRDTDGLWECLGHRQGQTGRVRMARWKEKGRNWGRGRKISWEERKKRVTEEKGRRRNCKVKTSWVEK